MNAQLTVSLRVFREQFMMEHFIGSDDIFALVKEGSFSVGTENSRFTANKNEGVLFRKNILYHRHVLSPVTLYLFRYKSDFPIFHSDHILFHDQERLSSTFSMLDALESGAFPNDFEYRNHLFFDLVLQYT